MVCRLVPAAALLLCLSCGADGAGSGESFLSVTFRTDDSHLEPAALIELELRRGTATVRETVTAHAWTAGATRRGDVERFLAWAEQKPWLIERPLMLWASRLLPFVIVPAVFLATASLVWRFRIAPPPAGWLLPFATLASAWWPLPLAAGIALSVVARRALTDGITAAISHLSGLVAYAEMLAHVESEPFEAPRLRT